MSEGSNGKSKIETLSTGQRVCCMELTVIQLRGLLEAKTSNDLIDELLLEDIRLPDLPLFTGLKLEDLEHMLPSDLEKLASGCKEANPSFFRMLAKVASMRQTA